MPYNIRKSKSGYKVQYKKGGKMHTVPGSSVSIEKAKKRVAAIEISKHTHSEGFDQSVNNLLKLLL
jgi:hypothetical protein